MSKNCYILPITLSEKSFKDFIIYDSKTKQHRFKTIIALTVCLFMLSTFCFASVETYKSIGTVGSILVALCVIIPTWYFNSFRNSIKEQTKRMNLTKPRHVYTVHLNQGSKGVELYYPEEQAPAGTYLWDEISGAWRSRNAIYLYITDTQAILIPDYITKNPDELWKFLEKQMDKKRMHKPRF